MARKIKPNESAKPVVVQRKSATTGSADSRAKPRFSNSRSATDPVTPNPAGMSVSPPKSVDAQNTRAPSTGEISAESARAATKTVSAAGIHAANDNNNPGTTARGARSSFAGVS